MDEFCQSPEVRELMRRLIRVEAELMVAPGVAPIMVSLRSGVPFLDVQIRAIKDAAAFASRAHPPSHDDLYCVLVEKVASDAAETLKVLKGQCIALLNAMLTRADAEAINTAFEEMTAEARKALGVDDKGRGGDAADVFASIARKANAEGRTDGAAAPDGRGASN